MRGFLGSWNVVVFGFGGCLGVDVSEKVSGCVIEIGVFCRFVIFNKKF